MRPFVHVPAVAELARCLNLNAQVKSVLTTCQRANVPTCQCANERREGKRRGERLCRQQIPLFTA